MSTVAAYQVRGMTCAHCVSAVSAEIAALDGVSDVRVELDPSGPSTVHVTSDHPLAQEQVAAAVDEAGYEMEPAA